MSLMAAPVATSVEGSASVSLDEVLALASLQTRVDRKYVMTPAVAGELLDGLGDSWRVLEIGGHRIHRYESTYFDTEGRALYLDAAHGRRVRCKVRTRTYVDSDECVLEVKRRSGRGETVKERLPYPLADAATLTDAARAFVAAVAPMVAVDDLHRSLTTSYDRVTFVDRDAGARMTCDVGLACRAPDGADVGLDDWVLIETKSARGTTAADRLLWSRGIRPVAISKYCVGLAALDASLPANKWHRTLHRLGLRPPMAAPEAPARQSVGEEVGGIVGGRSGDLGAGGRALDAVPPAVGPRVEASALAHQDECSVGQLDLRGSRACLDELGAPGMQDLLGDGPGRTGGHERDGDLPAVAPGDGQPSELTRAHPGAGGEPVEVAGPTAEQPRGPASEIFRAAEIET
jgi:hypothetical protein